jgi:glycosyltransferase involved in cell wall biosynthesis
MTSSSASRPHIVLASAEVWPFVEGGGIGRHVAQTAEILAAHGADVTVVTSAEHRARHDELIAAGDPRVPDGVRFHWAAEPPPVIAPFRSWFHAVSAAFSDAVLALARTRPIDLIEVEDYRGLGAVLTQAARAGVPELAGITVAVRLHTSWEMTAVLDRAPIDRAAASWVMALERTSLRLADRLIVPTAATLRAYRRFYGDDVIDAPVAELAPAAPAPDDDRPAGDPPPAADGVRLLYVGRLQEVKGVRTLVQALRDLDAPDVTLTLVGGDTDTGPGGSSMLAFLRREAGDDPRITFAERVTPAELAAVYDAHHVVIVPSRFESFGFVAREALARNRPVVVTPAGGLVDAVDDGVDGWRVPDLSVEALRATLERVLADPAAIDRMIAERAPLAAAEAASAVDAFVDGYLELAATRPARGPEVAPPGDDDALTVLVDATRGGDLADTLDALGDLADEPRPEVVVLARDPARVPAAIVDRVHAVEAVPDGTSLNAARTRALAARRAGGPVLLLEAGTTVGPTLTAALRTALAAPDRPPYATAYGAGTAGRNVPIGNYGAHVLAESWAAASVALLAPDAIALPLPEPEPGTDDDAALLAAFTEQGRWGAVVPEVLCGRVRPSASETSPALAARPLALAGGPFMLQDG